MAEESNNEDTATQRLVSGNGLRLAFDGFAFGDLPIRSFAMDALTTPIEGIESGELTIYNNALSLLTAAFSAKEKWTKDSEEEFKSEIEDMWGLASSGTALFLVKRFLTARRRFQHDHRGIRDFIFPWEKNLGGKQKPDKPNVKSALEGIRSSLVKPQWEINVVGLLTPQPGALPIPPADAEQHPNVVVSSEDLATFLQDELIARGLLGAPVYHECITKIINDRIDAPTRTKLRQMMIEARTGHSGDRLSQVVCNEVCDGIFDTFAAACLLEGNLQRSVSSLETWAARIELPPLDIAEPNLRENEEGNNRGEGEVAIKEENGVDDNDEDEEVVMTLSDKRKAGDNPIPESKRRR
ncbi:hypothetical protein F4776DRAFT_671979 [Hypoxylon sp. NC0597]|nr:hypothetical protein F4776DRAFT_671979 [Hypoxylon sp. NC0597]